MPRGRVVGDRVGPYDRFDFARDDEAEQRRQRRIAAGLTQADLALLACLAERTVRNWERNKDSRMWTLRSIERALRDRAGQPAVAGLGRSTQTGNAGGLE